MRLNRMCAAAAVAAMALSCNAQSAAAKEKPPEIPHCLKSMGSVAVREPDNKWWEGLGLESPEALIKILISQSGCFTLVDRGKAFEIAQQERALAAGGVLRSGSNVGRGQVRAADYVLVPDIVSKNADASGGAMLGVLGALVGGTAGAILGGINIQNKTADTTLTLVDVRSSEQVALAEGHGSKTSVGFGVGGGAIGGGVLGAAGAGAYANTTIGQAVMAAYIDGYAKLVQTLGIPTSAPAPIADSAPSTAATSTAATPVAAVTMSQPGHLYKGPDIKSGYVRNLAVGDTLYPTGNTSGIWREATDEAGNKGWVSSLLVTALAK